MTRSVGRSFGMIALAGVLLASIATPRTLEAQAAEHKLNPPARVSIVIERYQGDKKVASMPYSLPVTGAYGQGMSNGSLRIGVDVPIGSTTTTASRGTPATGSTNASESTAPQYRNIGTSIDCYLTAVDDGRFDLRINLNDTSLYDPQAAAPGSRGSMVPPARPSAASAFRTFSFNNTMRMRDGDTAEFITATDKITGEVVKAVVTLAISK